MNLNDFSLNYDFKNKDSMEIYCRIENLDTEYVKAVRQLEEEKAARTEAGRRNIGKNMQTKRGFWSGLLGLKGSIAAKLFMTGKSN